MVRRMEQIAYFALGSIAAVLGSIMFAIVVYQFVVIQPRLYNRLGMMFLFAWIAFLGLAGIKKALKISV
jgi:hypothetical protein